MRHLRFTISATGVLKRITGIMTRSMLSRLSCATALATHLAACGGADSAQGRSDWTHVTDSTEVRTLTESPSLCRSCITLKRVVVLGETRGPGYLEWTQWATRDSLGRYWVGQRGTLKVFDAAGTFVRQVGRGGKGPLEFNRPHLMHTDSGGNVHVLDPGNLRETVLKPDFALYEERRLPGFVHAAAPLREDHRYVVNMLVQTPAGLGMPLHIIEGPHIVHSFGLPTDPVQFLDAFRLQRLVATDHKSRIYSAKWLDYSVDVWTPEGRRITGFAGQTLNDTEARAGPWSLDNPPGNRLIAIRVPREGQLWVTSWRLRENWRDRMEERVRPDGQVLLAPRDDSLNSIFRSRIDLIDLRSASIVASTDREELFEGFVGDGLLMQVQYVESGAPRLIIWSVEATSQTDYGGA